MQPLRHLRDAARRRPALLVAAFLLLPRLAHADDRWSVSAEGVAMSVPALPSVMLGGMGEARFAPRPWWYASLRFGGGVATDSNETWDISQTHLFGLLGVGLAHTLGRARLSAELQGGALYISELDQRHQIQRLTTANIPDREQSSTASGPLVAIELAVDVELLERWFLRLSGGPQATLMVVDNARHLHGGVFTGIGVTHAF